MDRYLDCYLVDTSAIIIGREEAKMAQAEGKKPPSSFCFFCCFPPPLSPPPPPLSRQLVLVVIDTQVVRGENRDEDA